MAKRHLRRVRYVGSGSNVGFLSFRISGTDGVSLETKKWADNLRRMGLNCYFFAGEMDTPEDSSFEAKEADFRFPPIRALYEGCFDNEVRAPETTTGLHHYREILKRRIYEFIDRFDIDLLIPQNVLAIPLNLPLSMALTEVIAETNMPTLAHHHDFFWERKRFLHNCVWDILNACFPPHLDPVHHVVINSSAHDQLARRTGITSTLIPNVMEFEREPNGIDDYNHDVRQALGVAEDELLILQPTRVVQRKGIEHAIELVARLDRPARLVISHASGDEGWEYESRVRNYAKLLGVETVFVSQIIADHRGQTEDGRKVYSLADVYPHADLVTYPSVFEGFGNAFLETIHHKKPILVNNYSIYSYDIRPKGFRVIEMDDFITDETIDRTLEVLENDDLRREMVQTNYELGLKYYSYAVLERLLSYIISSHWGS